MIFDTIFRKKKKTNSTTNQINQLIKKNKQQQNEVCSNEKKSKNYISLCLWILEDELFNGLRTDLLVKANGL